MSEASFREIVVLTGAPFRTPTLTVQGTRFQLKSRRAELLQFGTRPVWRGPSRVLVSDPSRTLVDILDEPALGGGIRHGAEMLGTYWDSEHRDDALLLDYAGRLGNRTVFKRLGYLLERLALPAPDLIAECRRRQSTGISTLDPTGPPGGRIIKRWNLRVNITLPEGARAE